MKGFENYVNLMASNAKRIVLREGLSASDIPSLHARFVPVLVEAIERFINENQSGGKRK